METKITGQMTPQGLLIPLAELRDWQDTELEIVREGQKIVIRPKSTLPPTRAKVRAMLRESGMLYESERVTLSVVSQVERAQLAEKLTQGRSISELIIAGREDRI